MKLDIATGLLCIVLAIVWLAQVRAAFEIGLLQGQLKRLQATAGPADNTAAQPATPPLVPTQRPARGSDWHALPGQRMELGATGWAITLSTALGAHPYTLHTPEGTVHAVASHLQPLKDLGERLAAERAEFEPRLHPAGSAEALRAAGAGRPTNREGA